MKTCYIKSERTSDCLHALIYLLKPEINQYTMSGGKYESYKWFSKRIIFLHPLLSECITTLIILRIDDANKKWGNVVFIYEEYVYQE